jgi:hypothetical protein
VVGCFAYCECGYEEVIPDGYVPVAIRSLCTRPGPPPCSMSTPSSSLSPAACPAASGPLAPPPPNRERHISGATVTGRPTIDDDDDARTGSNATRCDLISNAERVCGSIRAVDRVGG